MPGLFDPGAVGALTLRNRFVRSATAECMADEEGHAGPRLVALYSSLAAGSIGLLITGGAYVHPTGRSYQGVLGVHDDSTLPALTRLTDAVHERGSRIALQLYHCGRQGEPHAAGGALLAPSAIPDRIIRVRPRAMADPDIRSIISAFADAAARAQSSGFDGVQILAANGYLINQFLSPHSNRRDDEWGGTLANRMRFLLEVYHSVRRAVGPDFPVLVKLTASDFIRGGLMPEESLIVAQALATRGVDALEVTGGTLETIFYMSRGEIPIDQILSSRPASQMGAVVRNLVRAAAGNLRSRVRFEEAYFAAEAAKIRRATRVPVMLVGGLRSPLVMDQLLREGRVDFMSMARPFLREPHFVRRIQSGDSRPSLCTGCNRCLVSVADGVGVRCYGGKR
ncbi:MAG: oxidoreductase [Chloroflexota bacterium]